MSSSFVLQEIRICLSFVLSIYKVRCCILKCGNKIVVICLLINYLCAWHKQFADVHVTPTIYTQQQKCFCLNTVYYYNGVLVNGSSDRTQCSCAITSFSSVLLEIGNNERLNFCIMSAQYTRICIYICVKTRTKQFKLCNSRQTMFY